MIILETIGKKYENLKVLDDINLSIQQGSVYGVVGASGCGKTTLLNVASLLDEPSSGGVYYDGIRATRKNYADLRKKYVSFVYQQHNLLPEFTILENIEIIAKFRGVFDEKKALELLDRVGIVQHKDKKPAELSGGQKQRASIVRAICVNPKVLFADEPTGNLDPETGEVCANLLVSLAREENMAVLLITHNLDIVKKCDYIYKIVNCQLVKL